MAAAAVRATEALLDSALASLQQRYACGDPPPDLAALAASLAYGLARNHPFIDGNKRTALCLLPHFPAVEWFRSGGH